MQFKDELTIFEVDLDMVRKYDLPGPRYTSYPTAPHFTDAFGVRDLLASLRKPANIDRPLSLYFHLPFCEALCYFCGCTMVVSHNRPRIRRYLDYLLKEIELFSDATDGREVVQVHWGGGTPTHLTPDEIRILTNAIHRRYNVRPDAEISVEVDPRTASQAHFEALREGGFNRISLGVQDFYEPTQRAVNRIQSEAMTRDLVDMARSMGFESVNLDLIYGLPYQTQNTFLDTVDKILDINPDRIALFSYAHVPWMKKHQNVIDEATLPVPEEKLRILKHAVERLTGTGYVFIGMDHFALPDDGLTKALRSKTLYRNFQGYSTYANCDLLGHGMSGISQTDDVYAQNTKDFSEYYAALDNGTIATERGYLLTNEDQMRRNIITHLMCDFSLNFSDIEQQYGVEFRAYFADALAGLQGHVDDGLVRIDENGIEVMEMGRLLIRTIAMPFDQYLQRNPDAKYSRTI